MSLLDLFSRQPSVPLTSRVPDVTVADQDGRAVSLREVCAAGPVLLFFYLRANTPVCTMHACRYRDEMEHLHEPGLQIFGVSNDPPERLRQFRERRRLPYRLLADVDGKVAAAFGVKSWFGFPERRAFLIRDGCVVWEGRAGDVKSIPPPAVAR